jgi:hypothetical protein
MQQLNRAVVISDDGLITCTMPCSRCWLRILLQAQDAQDPTAPSLTEGALAIVFG